MVIDQPFAEIELPFERPLYAPTAKPVIANVVLEAGAADVDPAKLYAQVVVDRAQLAKNVRQALQARSQVTLREVVAARPLEHGLAELVAYLQLAVETFRSAVDEDTPETIAWAATGADGRQTTREAHLPRIIFMR